MKVKLNLAPTLEKNKVFKEIENYLIENGFIIANSDQTRPWGGFFVIDETQSKKFIDFFFNDVEDSKKQSEGKISPKILIVEKGKRLSWQYHHRRSELWKVIGGSVGVVKSDTDKETGVETKSLNDIIVLKQGERHRLIGLDSWGIIAEIWQHTDNNNPSDEEDIVRVQDDFGR
jgi:mannose-6-phosphate isomerase-like protein (cupin superfamily)